MFSVESARKTYAWQVLLAMLLPNISGFVTCWKYFCGRFCLKELVLMLVLIVSRIPDSLNTNSGKGS